MLNLQSIHKQPLTINLISSATAALSGMLFALITSRNMSPEQFGILSALLALIVLISDLADFGISAGLLKVLSGQSSRLSMQQIVNFSFYFKLVTSLVLATLVISFSFVLNHDLLNMQLAWSSATILILAMLASSLFNLGQAIYQSQNRFLSFGVINNSANLVRLLTVTGLVVINQLTIFNVLMAYLGALVLSLILLLWRSQGLIKLWPINSNLGLLKPLFHFSKWLAIGSIFLAIFLRIDSLLVIWWGDSYQAGIYAVALRLTFIFPVIISALSAVMAVRLSSMENLNQAQKYLQQQVLFVSLIIVMAVLISIESSNIIYWLFGQEYLAASSILPWLVGGWSIYLFATPLLQFLIYYLNKPSSYCYFIGLQLISLILIDRWLIPMYGGVGAAQGFMVATSLGLGYTLVRLFLSIKK